MTKGEQPEKTEKTGSLLSREPEFVFQVFAATGLVGVIAGFALGADEVQMFGGLIAWCVVVLAVVGSIESKTQLTKRVELAKRESTAQADLKKHPKATRPVWDVAQLRLESYVAQNLQQVRWIFFVTVLVMVVGFALVGYGVMRAFGSKLEPAIVATSAGVLTEFVAATLLLIHRSITKQAAVYFTALERMNQVGMALEILDSIPDSKGDLKDQVRSDLARITAGAAAPGGAWSGG